MNCKIQDHWWKVNIYPWKNRLIYFSWHSVYSIFRIASKGGEGGSAGAGSGPEYDEGESDCPTDWIGDLICDDECNIGAHNFDDGDCCMSANEIDTSNCETCECILG